MIERLKILLDHLATDSVLSSELEELRGILDAFGRAGARKVQGWFRVEKHPEVGTLQWRIIPGAFSDHLSLRHNEVNLLTEEPLTEEPRILSEEERERIPAGISVQSGILKA